MQCLKARPHFLSPIPLSFPPSSLKPLSRRCFKPLSPSPAPASSPIKMSATSTNQIIEHLVLFKVKPDTETSKISTMINSLNALTSLEPVLHLAAGPILRNRSSPSSPTFTHMLHSRYRTKDDLAAYTDHPSHVSVAAESVRPICDDVMAVDWMVDGLAGSVVPGAGSAMRVELLKVKEGLGEKERKEVLGAFGGIKNVQLSYGENFSPARAKGFSICAVATLPGGMEELDSNGEVAYYDKEKVKDMIEGMISLDYVIPSSSPAPAPASL